MKKIILTGDRPTGRLHLGHFVGSLVNRLRLQDDQAYKQFIMIADMQAMTDNADNPEKVRSNVIEVALDYLAIGLRPESNVFFIQSMVPELSELTMYYLNLVSVSRLERNPTVKDEMKQKGFGANVPAGFLVYPVSQAADITAFKAELIPVGEDQKPMIEQTNEIVRRFNNTYNSNVLKECHSMLSATVRLPGTDGKVKMGKSLGNAIYLSDPEEVVKKKIMSMFTDPGHLKVDDPGKVEGNPVFAYLDAFDPNKEELEKLKEHYRRGGLGDMVLKNRLNGVIQDLLRPIRERRAEYEKHPEKVMDILFSGAHEARAVAGQTLEEVKEAMHLIYK